MTIACAWWDESDGLKRITAIADARAAVEKTKGVWEPLSDRTVKLFAIDVRCHELENGLDTNRTTLMQIIDFITTLIVIAPYLPLTIVFEGLVS